MIHRLTLSTLIAGICVVVAAPPASAQAELQRPAMVLAHASASPHANIHGVVLDDGGRPLGGAVVSAFGSTTAFAVSDPAGRFAFRNVPYGPYLVRAHLQGYIPPRARLVQVNRTTLTVSAIALTRRATEDDAVPVLTAGVAADDAVQTAPAEADVHDHSEVAWRLRHLKRGVLKDTAIDLLGVTRPDDSFMDHSLAGLGRAFESTARLTSLFADVPWNGHVDLLTTTSFDSPQELLSPQAWPQRGVAFVALEAPTAGGHWTMNGAVTQGDLSSWTVAASFRRAPAEHRYEAGISYGAQWALSRTTTAPALTEGSRNVGAAYAYDEWAIVPKLSVNYGAKYARYDYLAEPGLFSPRAGLTVMPFEADTLKFRAAVSRRLTAPGAEEFMPPTTGVWIPPERTFSSLSPRHGLTPQQLDHVELAAERAWIGNVVVGVRAFRQRIDDQLMTQFGAGAAGNRGLSHYYVASAGDLQASGWGVNVSHLLAERVKASVDYTQVRSTRQGPSPDADALALVAISTPGAAGDHFHDLTTSVASTLPVTDTRVFLVYKLNSRFADAGPHGAQPAARFDLRLTQALPFLSAGGAEWEVLVAVRSLFREELLDTSVYDELLVIRPPKRVIGGVTVRF
jgi:hypothetical protein